MAVQVAERALERSGVAAELRVVDVRSEAEASERRFLGSPSVHVDGIDVEPGAGERTDYTLACRVYRSGSGIQGWPEEAWVRSALLVRAAQDEPERSSATSP
jgi:hypothetical protein